MSNYKRSTILTVVLGFLSAALVAGSVSAQVRYDKRVAIAQDSLQVFIKFFHGYADESTPLWVLLPMMGHDHLSYAEFREEVWVELRTDTLTPALRRPYVLSPDLRGHGKSVAKGDDTLSYETMPEAEFAKYPADVMRAIESVVADEDHQVSGDSIYVVGASIGANTAALLTESRPGIKRIALLSPGLDYRGLRPYDALADFDGEALIYACEGDEYAAESARKLASIAPDRFELHIYPGTDHGTDIINNNKEAMELLVQWLLQPQRGTEDANDAMDDMVE